MTRPALLLLAAVLASCGGGPGPETEARGTVEVPEVDLAPMTAARVVSIRVEEGAPVKAGDTVATLTQSELGASLSAQRARLLTAEANLRDLEAGSRPEEIGRAQAEVAVARADADRTAKELNRIRDLAARDVVSKQSFDDVVAADHAAQGRLQAAEEALRLLKAGSRPERISAARGEVAAARAALGQVEARATDLVLVSTVTGIVLGRHAEPGEAIGAGIPVVTVGETARPYVRIYLPQSRVAGLVLGTGAEVRTLDGVTRTGKVVAINPKAEYSPRVALTEQERADLMFGVKIEFDRAVEAPHPGLWVTVRLGGAPGK